MSYVSTGPIILMREESCPGHSWLSNRRLNRYPRIIIVLSPSLSYYGIGQNNGSCDGY